MKYIGYKCNDQTIQYLATLLAEKGFQLWGKDRSIVTVRTAHKVFQVGLMNRFFATSLIVFGKNIRGEGLLQLVCEKKK